MAIGYAVAGTISPALDGNYAASGTTEGQNRYKLVDGNAYIYYTNQADVNRWFICNNRLSGLPNMDEPYFSKSNLDFPGIEGTYDQTGNGAVGAGVVTQTEIVTGNTVPNPVSGLLASGIAGAINLSWTNPVQFSTISLKKSTSAITLSSQGTLIYNSNGTSFSDTSAIDYNTTYYYGAYAVLSGVPSTVVSVSGRSLDGIPPNPVSGFSALSQTASIVLTWINPESDYASTVIRKSSSPITTITDGELIFNGTDTSFTDTSATDLTQLWNYGAYVLDGSGNASTIVTLQANSNGGAPNPPDGMPAEFYLPIGSSPSVWRQVQQIEQGGEF